MKRLLIIALPLLIISACNSVPEETTTELVATAIDTPEPVITDTPIPPTLTPTLTQTDPYYGCVIWSDVSLDDVGKYLCVYGVVKNTYTRDTAFFLTFSSKNEDFFLISYYDRPYSETQDQCIKAEGQIKQMGISPIILLGRSDEVLPCD